MTLLEIVVTLFVITMFFTPLFWWVQQSHRRTLRGGDETIATIYANDVIELIRGGPFEAFYKDGTSAEENLTLTAIFSRSPFFRGYDPDAYDSERFSILVDVGPAGDLDPKKMKKIRVRVSWKDKVTNHTNDIKMVTFYPPANL